MKVLLLTTHLNVGGIGIYILNLARYLNKNGVEVAIASSGGELLPKLVSEDIPFIRLDIKTKADFGIKMWRSIPEVVKIVKEGNFDVVHAQTRVAQVAACLSRFFTKVPVVTTCHGFFQSKKLFRKLFPCWGDRAIAISKSVKGHLVNDLGAREEKVDVVYNGIDLDEYAAFSNEKDSALMSSLGISDDDIVIGTVGRLSPVKGYRFLLPALKIVLGSFSNVKLLMVGEGPEKKYLENEIEKLGISGNVVMTPGGSGLLKYMELMDVFCMPSVHEGLGLSLMEAMASGRACVASDIGGLSELITNGFDGFLVRSQDPDSLSEGIIHLIQDEKLRRQFSWNARVKAFREFAMEKSGERTIKVYEEAIRQGA